MAAALVDAKLSEWHAIPFELWANQVNEIGYAVAGADKEKILVGPFLHKGFVPLGDSWLREGSDESWTNRRDAFPTNEP